MPTVRFGDAEVDFGRCELRRAGKPVELTAFEFKLLTALIRNSGKVLSRERLLDLVWGHGTFVTDRVVDNHVVTLRKKIEPEPVESALHCQRQRVGISFRRLKRASVMAKTSIMAIQGSPSTPSGRTGK